MTTTHPPEDTTLTDNEHMDVHAVAAYCLVSTKTIYRWRANNLYGLPQARLLGGQLRWVTKEIHDWAASRQGTTGGAA